MSRLYHDPNAAAGLALAAFFKRLVFQVGAAGCRRRDRAADQAHRQQAREDEGADPVHSRIVARIKSKVGADLENSAMRGPVNDDRLMGMLMLGGIGLVVMVLIKLGLWIAGG